MGVSGLWPMTSGNFSVPLDHELFISDLVDPRLNFNEKKAIVFTNRIVQLFCMVDIYSNLIENTKMIYLVHKALNFYSKFLHTHLLI